MVKKIIVAILFAFASSLGFSQNPGKADRLRIELSQAVNDTTRIKTMVDLCSHYKFNNPDSALFYGYKALELSSKVNYSIGEIHALQFLVVIYLAIGDDTKALQLNLRSLKISQQNDLVRETAICLNELGRIYSRLHNFPEATKSFRESINIFDSLHAKNFSIIVKTWFAESFLIQNLLDSAAYYAQSGYRQGLENNDIWNKHFALSRLAMVQYKKGNPNLAIQNLKLSSQSLTDHFDPSLLIAKLYNELNQRDSSIYFADKALEIALTNGFYSNLVETYSFLSILHEGDPKLALSYNKLALSYKERLFNLGKSSAAESFVRYDQERRMQELKESRKEFQFRLRSNILLGSTFTLLVIAFFLYRNSRLKQKAKQNIEKAYDQLKATQAQLIQSEKMASLGELTAGIAHEIQNPLNFVNNFSEVNKELIEELEEEIESGNLEEIKTIAMDIKENEAKITYHGKRADGIVKGMLQHSRSSTGEKEPTDINELCDEYLRLAYHGLRAKDKSFNASLETEFYPDLPKMDIVAQDMGRVFLNLINNAFYAVQEKAKASKDSTYKPIVKIITKLLPPTPSRGGDHSALSPAGGGQGVEITISDNGPGIPDDIKDKIFQPFFTTKPTGQGTGLGLSLSYDIVKAHGGEMRVESKDRSGTEFIIQLPT